MVKAVYRISWTEYERGWGQRPDGATLHRDQEEAKRFVRETLDRVQKAYAKLYGENYVPDDYSVPDIDPQTHSIPLVEVNDQVYDVVQQKGTVWEHNVQRLK